MKSLKCEICGGAIERKGNFFVCLHCRNKWEIDVADDVHAVDRANAWAALRDGDFERATELFESIILKDGKSHEAHWGRALALGGILYVTDLSENKKVPTCNNITEDSFINGSDVKKAISLAPSDIAESYKSQAEYIEKVRIEWLEKASKEPAYDVFISFKDSDRENGIERTQDSIDAQDLYNALVADGYKVFFSRISLRDKVSEQYEPYIYNAIKTAKVMIVFGEKPEYFSSVWIKNEWSRFKKRIENGEKHKNALVVVYKNMNPGDLPSVLKARQCLNALDITFLSDLNRHIKKVVKEASNATRLERIEVKGGQVAKKAAKILNETIETRELGAKGVAPTTISEQQRFDLVKSYMRVGEWDDANKLIEELLFNNPEYAEVIWCKLLTARHVKSNNELLKQLASHPLADSEYALIEKTINCAGKDFAMEILDLLYNANRVLSTAEYVKLLKFILPYNYPTRAKTIETYFTYSIEKSNFEVFNLLLSTLDKDAVDEYIDYHLAYVKFTRSEDEQKECIRRILDADQGNSRALYLLFKLQWKTESSDVLIETMKLAMQYSEEPQKLLLEKFDYSETFLYREEHCDFVCEALKYYQGELVLIENNLTALAYRMIEKRFFDKAEYLLNLVLSVSPDNAKAYFGICLVKSEASFEEEIKRSNIKLKNIPEYTKYLTLVNEERRQQCFAIVKKQETAISRRKTLKKIKITSITAASVFAALFVVCFVISSLVLPKIAKKLVDEGKTEDAYKIFSFVSKDGGEYKKMVEAGITDIVIPEGVTKIEANAFSGCTELKSVTIPKSVTRIGYNAFYNCTGLTEIKFNAESCADLGGESDVFANAGKSSGGISVCFGESVKRIPANLFSTYAESDTPKVNSVIIGDNVESIGEYAFSRCSELNSIVIGKNVKTIETSAFRACEGIKSIRIPGSVERIEVDAFAFCTSLESISFEKNGSLSIIGNSAFYYCEKLVSIELPERLKYIGIYAFKKCMALASVKFPSDQAWCVTNSSLYAGGTEISVSDSKQNASNLVDVSFNKYWYKK